MVRITMLKPRNLLILDLVDYKTDEFAGIGVTGFFIANGMSWRTYMELSPFLFEENTCLLGWILTILTNVSVKASSLLLCWNKVLANLTT